MAKIIILLTKEDIETTKVGNHVNIHTDICDINLSPDAIDELIEDLQHWKQSIAEQRDNPAMQYIQFTGNDAECMAFCPIAVDPAETKASLIIKTKNCDIRVELGNYIMKNSTTGEFSVVSSEDFKLKF